MCHYYVGRTARGQTVVYYVADGSAGDQAWREIRRLCVGGSVKAVSHREAEMALAKQARQHPASVAGGNHAPN